MAARPLNQYTFTKVYSELNKNEDRMLAYAYLQLAGFSQKEKQSII